MSDVFGIAGKTALVTGSGRNIGRAIVLELAGCGANVIVNTRSNQAEADSVAKEARDLGVGSLVVLGDVADKATVERMRSQAEATFGGVDIYVSNAARRLYKDFFEITDEEWHYHLNQQLTASWYLAKAFVPGMRERGWGRVVHVNGELPSPSDDSRRLRSWHGRAPSCARHVQRLSLVRLSTSTAANGCLDKASPRRSSSNTSSTCNWSHWCNAGVASLRTCNAVAK
ncbi:hypothetical protein ABIA39_007201 [Nocardia sp. GAS34]|uniref:SDR family NAD(P)-dependent oxidoreductase n=1 Tax=unclassified Nocardia TaxID=2637762 RepID=UPI003D24BE1A